MLQGAVGAHCQAWAGPCWLAPCAPTGDSMCPENWGGSGGVSVPCTSVCPCKIHVIKKLSAPQRTWQLLQSSCGETAAGPTPGLMRRRAD